MKPVSEDYEENRRKADDENRNGTLTKAALAAIDAAGIPDAPLDPRVMQLYQLREILGEYKLYFDSWHCQYTKNYKSKGPARKGN
jgi:hypothetical protein